MTIRGSEDPTTSPPANPRSAGRDERRRRRPRARGARAQVAGALVALVTARTAGAETLGAPAGGKPVPIGPDRVVCRDAPLEGGFVVEPDGRSVRPPPARDDAAGQTATIRVAANEGECAKSATAVTLVALGERPAADSLSVDVDAGRAFVRGKRLRGAVLAWSAGSRAGADACAQPDKTDKGEACAFAVPRDLPADTTTATFALLPAGARGADAIYFDATGRRVADGAFAVRPTEIVIARLVPEDAAVDLSQGTGRVPLLHPEAAGAVTCVDASCDVDARDLVVRGEHGADDRLDVRVQLRPHVVVRAASGVDPAPQLTIPLQRCPVSIASAAIVGGADESRVVVRLDGTCARAEGDLAVATAEGSAKIERTEVIGGAMYVVARTPRVESTTETITLRRRGTVLGSARGSVARVGVRARLELDDGTPLDFIPTNRWARVRMPSAPRGAAFELRPIDGVYDARRDGSGSFWIKGTEGATGAASIRLSLVDRSLPAPLTGTTIGETSEPVEHAIRVANVPIALGASVRSSSPLVELTCGDGDKRAAAIAPATSASIPYRARDTCQLVLHRERLRQEDGAQTLQVSIQVTASDGSARDGARVEQRIVLRPGARPAYFAVSGATDPFDRISVRVSDAGEGLREVTDEPARATPQAQWSIVTGTDHARLYGTTAIPTGLFRVADTGHSGILTLSVGALMRLVALSRDGSAFPLGLEAGVMWLGIAGDTEAKVASGGAVALVAGPGIAIPIANAARATQTSISVHAWFEYEVSRQVLNQGGQAYGFVFGPSISIGDVGTNF